MALFSVFLYKKEGGKPPEFPINACMFLATELASLDYSSFTLKPQDPNN